MRSLGPLCARPKRAFRNALQAEVVSIFRFFVCFKFVSSILLAERLGRFKVALNFLRESYVFVLSFANKRMRWYLNRGEKDAFFGGVAGLKPISTFPMCSPLKCADMEQSALR